MAVLKNNGPIVRENESYAVDNLGRLVLRTNQAVPIDTTLPTPPEIDVAATGALVNEVALKTNQTNEYRLVKEILQDNPEISGQFFSKEFGQPMIRKVQIHDASGTSTYDGLAATNQVEFELRGSVYRRERETVEPVPDYGFVVRKFRRYDDEIEQNVFEIRQFIETDSNTIDVGDTYTHGAVNYLVLNVQLLHYSTTLEERVLETIVAPAGVVVLEKTEYQGYGFQVPAIYGDFDTGWSTDTDFTIKPPWVGTHYTAIPHRTARFAAVIKVEFTIGPNPNPKPTRFAVTSPGAASRIIPIPENSIHPDFAYIEITPTFPSGEQVEAYPASTPPPEDWDPLFFVVVDFSEKVWRGNVYVRRTAYISPDTAPEDFPADFEVNSYGIVVEL